MNSTLFHFGAGARTCIGKNISLLEIYKLVPAFLRRFEVEFESKEREKDGEQWRLHNAWFVAQRGFEVRVRERELRA